jgi:tRNA-specific 2-thiouridylase
LSKREVRAMAREAGLLVAGKGESMEVCFVAAGVREFVEEQAAARPERFAAAALGAPATVVDESGAELGRAEPAYRYTVGQRRGLRVAGGERLYVLRVETAANRVVVGGEEELLAPGLRGSRLHWIGAPPADLTATVRIRARHVGVEARIRPRPGASCEVEFAAPQRGVAPGQAAVFYGGDRVLGGCWIEERL